MINPLKKYRMKKNKIVRLSVLFISSFLIVSCNSTERMSNSIFNCMDGEGTKTTKSLAVSDFEGVNLAFSSDVIIKQGDVLAVKAIGHPNIIDKILTTTTNNIWKMELEKGCYSNYDLTIEITTPYLNQIEITGSGDITVDHFTNQKELTIDMSGSGDLVLSNFEGITDLNISLSGSGDLTATQDITTLTHLNYKSSGSGDYSGYKLSSQNSTVRLSGSGDCKTTARDNLNVSISGSGDLSYKGSPTLSQKSTGSGDVVNAN